jgi:hypothetical protein
MTVKIRKLANQFTSTHTTQFKKLLVSGCSFTYNNSDSDICSWPYYLRDLAGFEQVYDCSQSGAGSNHVFNSVINEVETNPDINVQDTLVIIMWSGLTRTDVIAEQDVTKSWHHMSNYCFDDQFATLSIRNSVDKSTPLDQLCRQYKKLVSVDAQVYESLIKIVALKAYLDQKGFRSIITSWKDPQSELENTTIARNIVDSALSTLNNIKYLDSYAVNLKETDGHPTPDAYLGWTREHLLPYLESIGYVTNI